MRGGEPRELAAFVTASAIWGSTFLVIAIGNDALPPIWAATLRLALAAVLLLGLARLRGTALPRGPALTAAVLYGAFEFGVNFGLLYWGEQWVPSGIAAVVYATTPLSAAMFAWLLRVERADARTIFGAIVGLVGVVLIMRGEMKAAVPLGPLVAVVVAAIVAALAGVFLKRGPPQSAIAANGVGAAVGFAMLLPASFVLGEAHPIPVAVEAWLPILYLTLAGSVGAFVLFAWLINQWPVTKASFISVLIPLIAFALGAAVRGERPTPLAWAGAVLILGGVVVALTGRPSNAKASAASSAE